MASVAFASSPPAEADAQLLSPHKGKPVEAGKGVVFETRWRKSLVRTGLNRDITASFGRPAISERHERVIVGTGEGFVLALALNNGDEVWRYRHGAPFETAAAIVDLGSGGVRGMELALLGGRDGKLLAFEVGTGKLRWEIPIDGDMRSPPRRIGNELLVTTSTNKVYVLDPSTGAVRWTRGRPAPTGLTVLGHARAFEQDGIVYAAFSDGYAEAYALEDGRGMWSRPLSLRGGDFIDADADPVVINGRVFVASYSDGIYALEPRDGTTAWTKAAQAVTSLGAHDNKLLAASADGWFWGLDATTGDLLFRARLPIGPPSRPIVAGDAVIMTGGEGLFLVFDATNGKPLQATAMGGIVASEPVLAGDHLALISSLGYVVVMRRIGPPRS
jgi:outer membrane protein assembly factor BamB